VNSIGDPEIGDVAPVLSRTAINSRHEENHDVARVVQVSRGAHTALALAAAVLPATTALAQQVNYDFDRTADFGKYKTFAHSA